MVAVAKVREKSLHKRLFSFSKTEVQDFFAKCKSLLRRHFVTVLAQPVSADSLPRMLVIANRKVGKAHRRNRLRRLCKALFCEQQLQQLNFRIVLVFRQQCTVDRVELESLFTNIKQLLGSS